MLKKSTMIRVAANAIKGVWAVFCVAALLSGPAVAQSSKPMDEPRKAPHSRDNAKPDAAVPDAAPDNKMGPPEAKDAMPPKLKSALSNAPQTADEKVKLLGDLYAQLSTADDEAAAKKYVGQIERLWMVSGSDTIDLLMERANIAIRKTQPELAQKLLDRVVALAPDYAEGFNQRAYFHFVRNNFDAAVGDLRRTLALDPNHFKALEGLAQIWRETGNKKGALGVVKQLLDVNPFAPGAKSTFEELKREVEGQGI